MQSITIKGSQRESVGKAASKALRNAGQVPCVLYGGDDVLHFSAPELALKWVTVCTSLSCLKKTTRLCTQITL